MLTMEGTSMIPAVIFTFLTGAVLSWGFRVWVLIPLTLVGALVTFGVQMKLGQPAAIAAGTAVIIGLAPQAGYVCGLLGRALLAALRRSRTAERGYTPRHSRR
jgi:hypothetical protein